MEETGICYYFHSTFSWSGKLPLNFTANEYNVKALHRFSLSKPPTIVTTKIPNVKLCLAGLKVLNKRFPEGLLTGTVPQSCWPTPPPSRKSYGKTSSARQPKFPPTPADQKWFYPKGILYNYDTSDLLF